MRNNSILSGNERNTFDPQGNATRGEIAMMLYHFIEMDKDTDKASSDKTVNDESSILVVYFSMPETNRADNMTQEEDNSVVVIEGEVLGNTQYMVNVIQKQTGADIFRIEPETPYPVDHETLVDLAADERKTQDLL